MVRRNYVKVELEEFANFAKGYVEVHFRGYILKGDSTTPKRAEDIARRLARSLDIKFEKTE